MISLIKCTGSSYETYNIIGFYHCFQGMQLVSAVIQVPRTNYQLTLSSEPQKREQTVHDFASRCTGILQEALKWAPVVTLSLLQVSSVILVPFACR